MSTPDISSIADRLDRWRRSLIDTSQRNRLVNFRETAGVLRLTSPDENTIFDRLSIRGEELEVGLDADGPDASEKLLSDHDRAVVERTLLNLRIKARAAQREQGINILFLSIGLLGWKDSSGQALTSPLVLIPAELRRSGPLQPYRVAAIEEGAVVNPILEHKLRTEYSLELPLLPEEQDASSLGVVLAQIGAKIEGTGWTVEGGAYLGLFSFAKMPMYEELTAAQDLALEHPVVRALAGCPAGLSFPAGITPEQLDRAERPSQIYQVLDADSSQQEAIALAKQGASFVLQGPPGTGKSQTIANIIGETLAKGRTVLFVSEKMAALEVVKHRLDERGLGEYCMEMHSHKANRQGVAAELGRCLQPRALTEAAMDGLEKLEMLREHLNGYTQALHVVRDGAGISFFRINSELIGLREARDLPIQLPNLHRMGVHELEALGPLVRAVERSSDVLRERGRHPWRDCTLESWKVSAMTELERLLASCRDCSEAVLRSSSALASRYGLGSPSALAEIDAMGAHLRLAASAPRPLAAWLEDPTAVRLQMEDVQAAYGKLDSGMEELRSRYDEKVLSLDLEQMEERFRTKYASPLRWLRRSYRQDMRQLRNHRTSLEKLGREEAGADVVMALKVSQQADRTARMEIECAERLGEYFFGRSTEWGAVDAALSWCDSYRTSYGMPGEKLADLIVSGAGADAALREIGQMDSAVQRVVGELDAAASYFDLSALKGDREASEVGLSEIRSWAAEHLDTIGRAPEWVITNHLRLECARHGLHELLWLADEGRLPAEGLWDAVRKRYYSLWHDHLMTTDRRLQDFRREEHAEAVERFRKLDRKQLDIAADRLGELLQKRREDLISDPSPSLGSAMWVLRHEVNRKKGLRPLRELFSRAGEAILHLKPCLLMSPLSVSMHLDPSHLRFDLVIFDEASQIRPEDAIGSIMRGRQVIIVGDTKQLPPTDFFREVGEEDDEIPDLESILDECSACLPQRMLRWHYRSEDESLIAFSNRHFYGGRLFTFPSAGRVAGRGVSFVHVPEGCYDRGASRKNLPEARRVVDMVVEHFRRRPGMSLGVVAFSEAQQMAILEELEARIRAEPKLAPFFKEGVPEEFFVKNLESIQGDERDAIIFSLGYGKDAKGKMHQSLGPLNRAGGERRLNVAVTRARKALTVVSSILPSDLHPSSAGSELLKQYMVYAMDGGAGGAPAPDEDKREVQPLERAMVQALKGRGLQVHPRWGCSGYRIDLAVEGRRGMTLAVETDGPSYLSGPTARDRERLRQEALAKLGWKVHRSWSSDWVRDPEGEADRIARAAEEASAAITEEAGAAVHEVNGEETAVQEMIEADTAVQDALEVLEDLITETGDVEEDCSGGTAVSALAGSKPAATATTAQAVPYCRVNWEAHPGLAARLRGEPVAALAEAIEAVVSAEGPVHPLVVHERVRELYKVAGSRKGVAEAEETAVIDELIQQGRITSDGTFLWPCGMGTPAVRSSACGERRELWYVCMEELEQAILSLLEDGGMDDKTLATKVTALYGYKRPSPEARRRITEAVEEMIATDMLVRSGELVGRRY